MENILSFFDSLDEFIYCVEEGQTLVDISYKFRVPVSSLISDNSLTAEVETGRWLNIRRVPSIIVTPEDIADGKTKTDIPFLVVPLKKEESL